MPSDRRLQRLTMLLKELVSEIIDREIDFSEGTLVTVTRTAISVDGRYATVFLSALGGKNAEREALETLGKNIYAIQQMVNRGMRVRPVPQLRFAIDKDEAARARVEKSLADIERRGEL